ncbi:MAG: fumarylacetoacetate hydrolase family protein [Bdellovibrionota bacterium]
MFHFVRFIPKHGTPTDKPQYGVIKKFHFSAKSPEQVVVLEESPFVTGFDNLAISSQTIPLDELKLLAPSNPSKIIGIGLNYKEHAKEQGKPLPELPYVFLKAPSAIAAPGDTIRLTAYCTEVHFEGELVVVLGKQCKNVPETDALDYIAGYTIGNDVTDRTIQKQEPTFARAKSMDTFAPTGPFLVRGVDAMNLGIRTWVNGQLKQDGNTSDMIHPIPRLIHFISQFMTLMPGDLVFTGTPSGVGPLRAGDRVKVEIEKLGALENAVEHSI